MISYLIDGAILATLVAVGIRVQMTARELRRLRDYHEHYQFVLDETATAVTAVDSTVRDIHSHGAQILLALGERIGDGHKLVGEIDERMNAVAEQFEAERAASSNVLHFATAAAAPARREPIPEKRAAPEPEPRNGHAAAPRLPVQTRPPRPVEKPVQWPTLGDRFNQWRDSDEPAQRPAASARNGR